MLDTLEKMPELLGVQMTRGAGVSVATQFTHLKGFMAKKFTHLTAKQFTHLRGLLAK